MSCKHSVTNNPRRQEERPRSQGNNGLTHPSICQGRFPEDIRKILVKTESEWQKTNPCNEVCLHMYDTDTAQTRHESLRKIYQQLLQQHHHKEDVGLKKAGGISQILLVVIKNMEVLLVYFIVDINILFKSMKKDKYQTQSSTENPFQLQRERNI